MTKQTFIPDNLIVYDGPSMYDGQRIVAILQRGSSNSKTGSMAQLFILSAESDPITASRMCSDYSICGNCKHRGDAAPDKAKGWADNRTCYVNLLHAPSAKYKAFKQGQYKQAETIGEVQALLFGQGLRLGAYGDPAALPPELCTMLAGMASFVTSYTHGQTVFNDASKLDSIARFSMVSADSSSDALKSHSKGYRTFRVIPVKDWESKGKMALLGSEILCPASTEAGQRVQCNECRLCNGTTSKAKSIAIVAHGAARNKF